MSENSAAYTRWSFCGHTVYAALFSEMLFSNSIYPQNGPTVWLYTAVQCSCAVMIFYWIIQTSDHIQTVTVYAENLHSLKMSMILADCSIDDVLTGFVPCGDQTFW